MEKNNADWLGDFIGFMDLCAADIRRARVVDAKSVEGKLRVTIEYPDQASGLKALLNLRALLGLIDYQRRALES